MSSPIFGVSTAIAVAVDVDPKPKARKSVTFVPEAKSHDGLRPEVYIFEKLVLHCFQIGGFTSCEALLEFLVTASKGLGDFRLHYDAVIFLAEDLHTRILAECAEHAEGVVPLLPCGGGTATKCPCKVLPNIEHLLIVLKEANRRMIAAGSMPYVEAGSVGTPKE